MLTKRIIAISLALPLAAISSTAFAGSTITDKSYWPIEARPSMTADSRGDAFSAFAYDRTPSRLQPVAPRGDAESGRQYRGGPKSN